MATRGEFELPAPAMVDVKAGYSAPPANRQVMGTTLAARYASVSGRFLCAHPDAILHGSYAGYVDDTGALDARMACGEKSRRPLIGGGANVAAESHWIGLPRRLWTTLGRTPVEWIGPFGIAHVQALASVTASLPSADPNRYLLRDAIGHGDQHFVVEFDTPRSATVVVSSVLRYFAPVDIDEVTANDVVQRPFAETAFVQLHRCGTCEQDAVHWRIRYRAARSDTLDVLRLVD
jgi:hypothetical protein